MRNAEQYGFRLVSATGCRCIVNCGFSGGRTGTRTILNFSAIGFLADECTTRWLLILPHETRVSARWL
ncbi:hypothetical protein FHR71_004811 [Methylobacterium sp. RAS18]|nr:hypothetical protein [Methylobacterium sp. RAS18]